MPYSMCFQFSDKTVSQHSYLCEGILIHDLPYALVIYFFYIKYWAVVSAYQLTLMVFQGNHPITKLNDCIIQEIYCTF